MNLFRISIIYICLIIGPFTHSQDKLQIQGNKSIPSDTIIHYMNINSFTDFDINQSVKNLYRTNFFSSISIKKKKETFMLIVKENYTIKNFIIIGNKSIRTINKIISLKEGDFFSEFLMNQDIRSIRTAYRALGYTNCTVSYRVNKVDQNCINVIININENILPNVKDIKFIGNSISNKKLLSIISSKKLPWYKISIKSQHDNINIDWDKQLLTQFYRSKGYLDFTVLLTEVESSFDFRIIYLTFVIDEGSLYKVAKIHFDCDSLSIDKFKLDKFIFFQKNDTLNIFAIENSVKALQNYFDQNGYHHMKVYFNLVKNIKDNLIDVNFLIKDRSKLFIRKININGNYKTEDFIIRREILLNSGDLFSSDKLKISKKRLLNLGFFRKIEHRNFLITNHNNKVDINLNVEESGTGSLQFQVGYATGIGPLILTKYSENNIAGKGKSVSLNLEKSLITSKFDFNYYDFKFFSTNVSLGIEVFIDSINKNEINGYSKLDRGFTMTFGYELIDNLYYKLNYSLNSEKVYYDNLNSILHYQPNNQFISYIGQTFTYSSVNNTLDPTKGYTVKFTQNIAGLGGNVRYIKSKLEYELYRALTNKLVLHMLGRAGSIFGYSGWLVSVSNNFFIGDNYIRGFESIGPIALDNKKHLGGKKFFTVTAELNFPLYFFEEWDIKGSFFIDAANLFNTDIHKFSKNLNKNDFFDRSFIRSSYGIGVVWNSPFGKIRFDYGIPIVINDTMDKKKTDLWGWKIGTEVGIQ